MATTLKKSTAKKKTSKAKKLSTKKIKTTKARVSSKSTTAKKSVVKKAVVKSKPAARSPWDIFKKLDKWNTGLGLLHAVQGVVVLVLSGVATFAVTTNFLTLDKLASTDNTPVLVQATRTLFDINLAYIVAAFFFMSAIAHLIIATVYRKRYESDLKLGINRARWIEYGVSASTMMVGIALLSGVSDLSTLVSIFGATLVMNLLGLVMEVHNQTTGKTNWLSYIVGTISGIVPWLVVGIYFLGANQYGEGTIPSFVYWIYGSIFVFFSSFAVNMYLQYKKIGRWADYMYGEKTYMILSLVAKSALAWQIFFGALRP